MFEREARLASGPAAVEAVVRMVDELTGRADLDDDRTYWLRLAADEISTNIANHAYAGAPGVLDVRLWADDERVTVQLEDEGAPFDLRGHDWQPQLDASLEEREEGGFGLFLALHKLDDFRYDRVRGRNRNRLVMCRRAASPGPESDPGPGETSQEPPEGT